MANYRAKGTERMRELGRLGGRKSGDARRLNRVGRILWEYDCKKRGIEPTLTGDDRKCPVAQDMQDEWEASARRPELKAIAEYLGLLPRRGGSHNTDWRCPKCERYSSIKKWLCTNCGNFSPKNGRLTRAALRAREKEHKTTA